MQLALLEDRLEEGARLSLPAGPRVLYVVTGRVEIDRVTIAENDARHLEDACSVQARTAARVWRWELRPDDAIPHDTPDNTLKLRQPIALPPGGALMRADRVDFPARGIAYAHTHQEPGIRMLPAALLGKSSIRYVKAEDQARPKSQTYTVFVDALIS